MVEQRRKLAILRRDRTLGSVVVLALLLTGTAAPGQEADPAPIRVPPPSSQPARAGAAGASRVGLGLPHSSGWWFGTSGIALVLAVCGTVCALARRYRPQDSHGLLRVVGRVSLSPRHSIFMVRAGRRMLLVGTGNQGAPTLLGELYDDDQPDGTTGPADGLGQEARDGRPGATSGLRPTRGLDVLLGDEE